MIEVTLKCDRCQIPMETNTISDKYVQIHIDDRNLTLCSECMASLQLWLKSGTHHKSKSYANAVLEKLCKQIGVPIAQGDNKAYYRDKPIPEGWVANEIEPSYFEIKRIKVYEEDAFVGWQVNYEPTDICILEGGIPVFDKQSGNMIGWGKPLKPEDQAFSKASSEFVDAMSVPKDELERQCENMRQTVKENFHVDVPIRDSEETVESEKVEIRASEITSSSIANLAYKQATQNNDQVDNICTSGESVALSITHHAQDASNIVSSIIQDSLASTEQPKTDPAIRSGISESLKNLDKANRERQYPAPKESSKEANSDTKNSEESSKDNKKLRKQNNTPIQGVKSYTAEHLDSYKKQEKMIHSMVMAARADVEKTGLPCSDYKSNRLETQGTQEWEKQGKKAVPAVEKPKAKAKVNFAAMAKEEKSVDTTTNKPTRLTDEEKKFIKLWWEKGRSKAGIARELQRNVITVTKYIRELEAATMPAPSTEVPEDVAKEAISELMHNAIAKLIKTTNLTYTEIGTRYGISVDSVKSIAEEIKGGK